MNKFARLAKSIATLLLLASFFMPLTRCSVSSSQPASENDKSIVQDDKTPSIEKEYFDVRAYDFISFKDGPLWLLAFTWPLVFQVIALVAPARIDNKPVMAVEALLLLFSALQIGYLIYQSDGIRYGTYVAYSSILVYITALAAQSRGATPNNSFKPSPLRGLGANRFRPGGPA